MNIGEEVTLGGIRGTLLWHHDGTPEELARWPLDCPHEIAVTESPGAFGGIISWTRYKNPWNNPNEWHPNDGERFAVSRLLRELDAAKAENGDMREALNSIGNTLLKSDRGDGRDDWPGAMQVIGQAYDEAAKKVSGI